MKTAFWFRLRHGSLRLSENWVVGDASRSGRTNPVTKRGKVTRDWFILPLLFPTPTIWFSLDHKRNVSDGVGRKWGRSDSSDSDSVALIIFLIFTRWPLLRLRLRLAVVAVAEQLHTPPLFCRCKRIKKTFKKYANQPLQFQGWSVYYFSLLFQRIVKLWKILQVKTWINI